MAGRFTEEIDGEGVAWAAAGFVASLLIGVAIEPFRGTVGLENVALGYLLVVVVAAAVGGRAAGLISALSAALSYDFFLTTPYHSLRIDSVAQVITVALLFGTGIVASLAGRARRRRTVEADTQAGIIRLLNTITRAAAAGEGIDRLAAEGIYTLVDARRVVIRRGAPDNEVVVADIGEPEAPSTWTASPASTPKGTSSTSGRSRPGGRWCGGCDLPRGPSPSWSSTGSPSASSS
jgi:K+-sensing histidine kinase KdpD